MTKMLFFASMLLLLQLSAYSQQPTIIWTRYPQDEEFIRVANQYAIQKTTSDDGYIAGGVDSIVGFSTIKLMNKSGGSHAMVYKLDSRGAISWWRLLGTGAVTSVFEAPTGHYMAAGTIHPSTSYMLSKLNRSGTVVWTRTYGGTQAERAYQATNTMDQGFIMAGYSYSSDGDVVKQHPGSEVWLVKTDSAGTKQWAATYGGSGEDTAYGICPTPDGGFIVCGSTTSADGDLTANKGSTDGWIFKVNSAGNLVWQKNVGGSARDVLNAIVQTGNSFTLSGFSNSNDGDVSGNHGNADYWVLNIDGNGNINWSKLFGGTANDIALGMTATTLSGVAVTGYTESTDGDIAGAKGGVDSWTVNVTNAGALLWQLCAAYNNDEFGTCIAALSDNNFTIGGLGVREDLTLYHTGFTYGIGAVNSIIGHLYLDANNNGVKDAGEGPFNAAQVISQKTGLVATTTPVNGRFENKVDLGTYTTTVKFTSPYYLTAPASVTSNFANYYLTDSFDFAVQVVPGKRDASVTILPVNPSRPGFDHHLSVLYTNKGSEILSGTVKVAIDSRQTFKSASITPSLIDGDTLFFDFSNLALMQTAAITVTVTNGVMPDLNLGDTLKVSAVIQPVVGDETPNDNTYTLKEIVVGSYDPNDKTEANAGVITPAQITGGEYLNYLIRFQNTGTDTAFKVVVKDTLDSRLNWNSFEMVSASHPYQISIENGNIITWQFNNILLPDSNVNEPFSHGYIAYRIKPQPAVPPGDTIKNTAGIYFDYNFPIITNTEKTIVLSLVALPATLLSFNAILNGDVVDVKWKTTLEHNVAHFEILRSADGIHFARIGTVQPGSSFYVFKDRSPLTGVNHYRLKTVDADGATAYSTIAVVSIKDDGQILASIYPNPSPRQALNVKLQNVAAGPVHITVIDQLGRTLLAKQYQQKQHGEFRTELPTANLTKGSYMLRITANGKVYVHKLVLQ